MVDFIKALTPKDTEEVKPGVFLQKTRKGWRQIHPAAWNGKINWKNLILGPDFLKHLFIFAVIMFVVWSYVHDTSELREFHDKVSNNKVQWCAGVPLDELSLEGSIGRGGLNEEPNFTSSIYNNIG